MKSASQVGAFFDLDGTLLPSPSLEWRFIAWLAACDAIDAGHLVRWLGHFARNLWLDPYAATFENKLYLGGLCESLAARWESERAHESLRYFAAGVERVAWHRAQGHRVFLITGTLAPLARAAASRLPGPLESCATELEVRDGRWTGRLAGEHQRGEAKAYSLRLLALRHHLDLSESYAYGNCLADLPMLESVGHPVAVNPDSALERIACSEGSFAPRSPSRMWRMCRWKSTEAPRAPHLVSASESR